MAKRTGGASISDRRIGRIVRMLREREGISLDVLGAAVGVDRTVVSKMERGLVSWSTDAVAIACRTLGVPVSAVYDVVHVEDSFQAAS